MKEAIFFCMVGLPLFGKEGSRTPVFKILVRALHVLHLILYLTLFLYMMENMHVFIWEVVRSISRLIHGIARQMGASN